MSLFDDASLAMIPSAYKDGKLYSIKPTDGSGDFTFSRGSNLAATRVDENGLIEKGRENLLLQSNQFDTTWTNVSTTETGGQTGYDGSSDAWLLSKSGANGRIQQSVSSSGVTTFSVYAKANDSDYMEFFCDGGAFQFFDLSNGILAAGNGIDATIESIGGGWYRCSMVQSASITRVRIYPAETNTTSATSGSIYIQDAQLERGLVATDYIETTTTTAQAGILEDMPRLDYSGGASCPSLLLEPQRTNLFTQSEYFNSSDWSKSNVTATDNSAISPDGLQNATLINDGSASTTQHWFHQSPPLSSGTTYTISFYAKYVDRKNMFINIYDGATSNFVFYDIQNGVVLNADGNAVRDIVDVGSGWYRITYTRTIVGSGANFRIGMANDTPTATYTGENKEALVYGFQIESNASYASSYIPTYGTSQTRSDDFMNISSLADEIDGNSFTYFLEINNEAVVRDSATGNISVGASGNRFFLYNDSSATARMKLYIQDVTTQSYQLSADNVKLVVRIEPNKVEVFENGVSVLSTTQNLDFSGNSSYVLRGATREMGIKQTAIFPTPLTDSECIALTTL
jgi:hypothetical protein